MCKWSITSVRPWWYKKGGLQLGKTLLKGKYLMTVRPLPQPCRNAENAETGHAALKSSYTFIYNVITSCSSTTINSHIFRMYTIVGSIGVSWARGQSWFRTSTPDIVQPDSSGSGTKAAEQYSIYVLKRSDGWGNWFLTKMCKILSIVTLSSALLQLFFFR